MKATSRTLGRVLLLALLGSIALAQADPLEPMRTMPSELTWQTAPNGVARAFVVGDDKKPGMYAYFAKFPPNIKLAPHWHPDDRVVTVISGTVRVGYGERWDDAAMKDVPAGGTWTEPARQPHFTGSKDGEAIIYIVGNGPSGTTPVEAPKQ
jgi:quercetin dioxygenase-like cupin family protein